MADSPDKGSQTQPDSIFVSLSEEQAMKAKLLTDEEIRMALEQGRAERKIFEANARTVHTNCKVLFR